MQEGNLIFLFFRLLRPRSASRSRPVPFHLAVDRPVNKPVHALAAGRGVGLDGIFFPFMDPDKNFVVSFVLIALDAFIAVLSTQSITAFSRWPKFNLGRGIQTCV